jgi:hypothetical protein
LVKMRTETFITLSSLLPKPLNKFLSRMVLFGFGRTRKLMLALYHREDLMRCL